MPTRNAQADSTDFCTRRNCLRVGKMTRMKRRIALALLPGLFAAVLAGCTTATAAQPTLRISLAQMQKAVAQRFPLRNRIEGLLDFDVQAPTLSLLPELNRVESVMLIDVSGPALRRSYQGSLDIDFALRYEPGDQTLRAHQLQVRSLRFSGLAPKAAELLDSYGQRIAQQSLHEVVLHRLSDKDLALAETMGLQPATITVTAQGLLIGFEPKAR